MKRKKDWEINDRFIQAANDCGLDTVYSIAKELGKSTSQIYAIRDHKNQLSTDILVELILRYKGLDAHWILTGEKNRTDELVVAVSKLNVLEEEIKQLKSDSEKLKEVTKDLRRKEKIIDVLIKNSGKS